MTYNKHVSLYSTQVFLEGEMFKTEVVEEIKTHVLCSVTSFSPRKSCYLWDNVGKYTRAGEATDDNMAHELFMLRIYTHSEYVILIALSL
jgi:hypothetical protein